jgi:hypothetical protein
MLIVIVFITIILLATDILFTKINTGTKECNQDQDCMIYGELGDCNCGCYNVDNPPAWRTPVIFGFIYQCRFQVPSVCECKEGTCIEKYE